jgi:6-phosphogluconolactonase
MRRRLVCALLAACGGGMTGETGAGDTGAGPTGGAPTTSSAGSTTTGSTGSSPTTSTTTTGTTGADTGTDEGATTGPPAAQVPYVYVGGQGAPVTVLRMDPDSGALTPVGSVDAGKNPTFLAFNPARFVLHAVNEAYDGSDAVATLRVAPEDGGLTPLGAVDSAGVGPAHVSVDATGAWALAANYGGGTIAVFPVLGDGSLGAAAAVRDLGADANPHQLIVDPSNTRVLAVNRGRDDVLVYPFDAGTGALGEPVTVARPPGSGPRHLAFHPDGAHAYLLAQDADAVTAFAWSPDAGLQALQTLSSLPPGFAGENDAAEIEVHPDGRFVYASNRGHDSVAVFTVDAGSGTLASAGHVPSGGATPWCFDVDPGGRFLLVANTGGGQIVGFDLDPVTGTPTANGASADVTAPTFVRVVLLPGGVT